MLLVEFFLHEHLDTYLPNTSQIMNQLWTYRPLANLRIEIALVAISKCDLLSIQFNLHVSRRNF